MSDGDPPPAAETPAQVAEAAAIRRRWITLGEVLAVAAVLISGLTLWNSYSERSSAEADRHRAEERAEREAETLLLQAVPGGNGRRLTLSPVRDDQTIQSQTIMFPSALGLKPVETTGESRIEGEWFDDALKKARRPARKETGAGDYRLLVAISTRFLGDGAVHSVSAIYDIGYVLEERFLQGAAVRLRGLSIVGQTSAEDAQARVDALWTKRQPTISSGLKK